ARVAQIAVGVEPRQVARSVDGAELDACVGDDGFLGVGTRPFRIAVAHGASVPRGRARRMAAVNTTNPNVEDYIRGLLARHDEPVLLEMEADARERGFPIIGRMVGVAIEILARSIGARRVFELGSGYGYSAYWFARAVGQGGEVHLTDGDPA